LALGRRSRLPVVRALSITWIEVVRGVPLIAVLFMASVMFALFMPAGFNVEQLLRAQVAIIVFVAAYLAEVIRGGLQAVPRGQYEAAQALGLPYWRMMGLVILPQALRIAIPPIVNSSIALFKDTSLVVVIAIFDFAYAVKNSVEPDVTWKKYFLQAPWFSMLVYWLGRSATSLYSRCRRRRTLAVRGRARPRVPSRASRRGSAACRRCVRWTSRLRAAGVWSSAARPGPASPP